jgi:hypothetical protein
VAAGTGCDNPALIQQQLAAAGGDVDAAIEAVIEILAAQEEPAGPAAAAEAPAPAVAVAVASTDETAAAGSIEIAVGCEQQQAAAGDLEEAAVSPSLAASEVVTNGTPDQGNQCSSIHEAVPAAATAEVVTGSSTDAQSALSADASAAAATAISSDAAAPQSTRQHASAAATAAGASKGVRLKGGSKLKHGKGCAAGGDGDKRPSRNKPCPCGSGRKHKNCCELKSSGSAKPSGQEVQAGGGLPVQLATLHI